MNRRSEIAVESTWMRFEVIVNAPGFPDDNGDELALKTAQAIRAALMGNSELPLGTEVKITETTE